MEELTIGPFLKPNTIPMTMDSTMTDIHIHTFCKFYISVSSPLCESLSNFTNMVVGGITRKITLFFQAKLVS